jgi:hypothetical protein
MLLAAGLLLAASTASAQVIDGSLDGVYGPALSTQTTQTQFGDNGLGAVDYAGGSELDVSYAYVSGGSLYIFLAGNLESNFNKLELFIDCKAGGQNRLRGDNPNVDFNGLNRMGDDGSGNGLTFDSGYEADFYLTCTGGGGPYALYANYAEVLTGGGGSGSYLGQAVAGGPGTLSGGVNPNGIELTINNSNNAGVSGGCAASSGAGVLTGIEWRIPLTALPGCGPCYTVSAFINGGGHDFLANQVLGPLDPGTCNLGEPRLVNFDLQNGVQSFRICDDATPARKATWGQIKTLYR